MKNSSVGSEHVAVAVPWRGCSMRRRVPGLPERSRCLIMGIVNVTADSFSDGGRFGQAEKAVEHGLKLAAGGPDLIDIGGESARPGARRVPVEVEFERVVPVVRELSDAGLPVSIDTTRDVVADAAIRAGACLVNDVRGGLADSSMARCVADAAVPYIAMRWRAPSVVMHRYACYQDVVVEVPERVDRRARTRSP
jgi:dihydropteroate synthase